MKENSSSMTSISKKAYNPWSLKLDTDCRSSINLVCPSKSQNQKSRLSKSYFHGIATLEADSA